MELTDARIEPEKTLPLEAVVHGGQIRLVHRTGASRSQICTENIEYRSPADGRWTSAAFCHHINGARLYVKLETRPAMQHIIISSSIIEF